MDAQHQQMLHAIPISDKWWDKIKIEQVINCSHNHYGDTYKSSP